MAATFLHADEMKREYLVERNLPTIWCEGCGIGTVIGATMRAVDKIGLPKEKFTFTIGIGCSGYSSRYVGFDVSHAAHGRALAVATGIKVAKPSQKVITLTGDGDCTAIGGNHFIHAARRNIDVTAIIFNNNIYGMTGGQYSPATPFGANSTTSPYGMVEGQIDPCELAKAAGATFVARTSTFHVTQAIDLIAQAIEHPGFSVVEVLTQCPNQFGRLNKRGTAGAMMKAFKDACVRVDATKGAYTVPEGKTPIGILHLDTAREEYTAAYARVQEGAQQRAGK